MKLRMEPDGPELDAPDGVNQAGGSYTIRLGPVLTDLPAKPVNVTILDGEHEGTTLVARFTWGEGTRDVYLQGTWPADSN